MNEIESLIEELEDIVFRAKRKTFSDEITLDRQSLMAVIQDLKETVPAQIRDADYILNNRDKIISDAQNRADDILANASSRANKLIDESAILHQAQKEADLMIADAKRYLDKIEIETRRSILDTIGRCEDTLGETITILRNCREDLKGSLLTAEDTYNK